MFWIILEWNLGLWIKINLEIKLNYLQSENLITKCDSRLAIRKIEPIELKFIESNYN